MANLVIKFLGTSPNLVADLSLPASLSVENTGPYLPATITTPSGTTPIDGTLTTGTTPVWSIANKGGAYIVVSDLRGHALPIKFPMDSLAAANTGFAALLVKIGAGVPAVSLTSAGVVANL
jgi:hypothetical protein